MGIIRMLMVRILKSINTWRLSVQIRGVWGRAYKRPTSILNFHCCQAKDSKKTHISPTHNAQKPRLMDSEMSYTMKHNFTYFPFFVNEMHILSTIIVNLDKRYQKG